MASSTGQAGPNSPKKPLFLHVRSSGGFVTLVVTISVFTDMFLYGLIVPVTPTALEERVGIAKSDQQHLTSILLAIYGAALFIASPISGYIADRMESRLRPFLVGLVALAASTGLLCAGSTLGLWIAGRIFQGISAAVVWTVGLALLVDTVEKRNLGQSLGYIGMAVSLGTLAGPLLGGVIYQSGGYYAVFATAFGLIGVDILLRITVVERKHAVLWLEDCNPGESSEPEKAQDLAVHDGENNIRATCEAVSPDRTPATAAYKRKLPAALILLSSPRLLCAFWAYFIVAVLLSAFDAVLPLFVSDTFHWKQAGQGLIFIPIALPQAIEPGLGALIDRLPHSRRYLASAAFLCSIPPCVCLGLVTENSIQHKALLCGLLAILGFCIACVVSPVVYEINEIVSGKEETDPQVFGKGGAVAQAYGLLNCTFALGNLLGPIFAGFLRKSAGWATMAWALAVLGGVSALPVLLMSGGLYKIPRNG